MQHPAAALAGDAEVAGRQRARADEVEVGISDAAAGHRRAPAGVGLHDLIDRDQLFQQDRRLAVADGIDRLDGVDRAAGQRRDDGAGGARLEIEEDGSHAAIDRIAVAVSEHRQLVGLFQTEQRELRRRADQAVVVEEGASRADLVRGQALERVRAHGRDRHNAIDSLPGTDAVKTLLRKATM